MKNLIKISKYIICIVIVIIFCLIIIKNKVYGQENSNNITDEQKAVQEVANAYYSKGINAQYCSSRKTFIYSPEEATSQHNIYSVCSSYPYSIYYQSFGIQIPFTSSLIIAYADEYYDNNNIETNDVIEYWKKTTDENKNTVYRDNKDKKKNKEIDLSTDEGRKKYGNTILNDYNLQIGDVICYHTGTAGHVLLVYDFIYDENGKPIDAIIRESTSKYEQESTKITKGLSYADIRNDKNDINQGTFQELYLINKYQITSDLQRPSLLDSTRNMSYFAIYRPLIKDVNGNYTGQYYDSTYKAETNNTPTGYVYTDRKLTDYKMTEVTKKRLNYSKIFIDKVVDVFNNSIVNIGDTLEYSIKIRNNSNEKYNDFEVLENISNYVEIYEIGDGKLEGNTIKWTVQNLKPNEIKEIKYKVKVKKDITLIGKNIISTGTVAGIPSSTVVNNISSNLKETEKNIISQKTENLINSINYVGKEFISNIYKNSFGLNIDLNFQIEDLISTTKGTQYYPNEEKIPTIEINKNNSFYEMMLINYYGALYTENDSVNMKRWENSSAKIIGRSERADTIYKENFETGDVLVYKNKQTANDTTKYRTEDGVYYLIYISEENKIKVGQKDVYGFIGIDENNEINEIATDFTSLQTLLGKDYYVILRPSKVIDVVPMELEIQYSTTKMTNNDVMVTIVSNEELLEIEGWNLSNDKKKLSKIYKENTKEEIKLYDYAGNETIKTVEIKNIDKICPTVEIQYSNLEVTSDDVTVKIISNERLKEIEGWNLSEDEKVLSKTYNKNVQEEILVYDIAGNKIISEIKINNIDKIKPEYKIEYSTTLKTNKDVIVKIIANEEIQEIDGWDLLEDKKTLTKTYTKNGEETIAINDILGNTTENIKIKVNNIDKEKPEITVKYSTTEKTKEDVIVTITSNEEIQEIEGWNLSEDMKTLTKTYTKNEEETITIKDKSQNEVITKINISNIEKLEYSNENSKKDDSIIKNEILPNAGKINTLITVIIVLVITIGIYLNLRRYKDVK